MKIRMILCCTILLFTLIMSTAHSESEENQEWERLIDLKSGKKISVLLKFGGKIDGKFSRVDDQQLTLLKNGEEVRLKRQNISLVTARKPFINKKSLLGAGIGFGLGFAYGIYFQAAIDEGYGTAAERMKTGFAFGSMGAAGGLVVSYFGVKGGNETIIYRAPLEVQYRSLQKHDPITRMNCHSQLILIAAF